MNIFATNYLTIRNEYILPLLEYSVKYEKKGYWNLKETITKEFIDFKVLNTTTYEIEIKKDDFYKSLYIDIENFYTRSIIQYADLEHLKNHNSAAWIFVTQYYLYFFSITTLLRILRRGFLFINTKQAQQFTATSRIFGSGATKIDAGSYFFKIKQETKTDSLILELKLSTQNIHQQTWIYVKSLLVDFKSAANDEELTILEALLKISSLPNLLISDYRNIVNYSGIYGFECIDRKLLAYNININSSKYFKSLLSLQTSKDINENVKSSNLFGFYFYSLSVKLYNDFSVRCRDTSKFEKVRNDYLKKKGVNLKYLK